MFAVRGPSVRTLPALGTPVNAAIRPDGDRTAGLTHFSRLEREPEYGRLMAHPPVPSAGGCYDELRAPMTTTRATAPALVLPGPRGAGGVDG